MKRRPILFALLVGAIVFPSVFSQNRAGSVSPTPVGGWDLLKASIEYPELLRRAGLEGIVVVSGTIDKSGLINDLNIQSNHSGFTASVERALKDRKWIRGKVNDKRPKTLFSVHFRMTGKTAPKSLTVEGPAVTQ